MAAFPTMTVNCAGDEMGEAGAVEKAKDEAKSEKKAHPYDKHKVSEPKSIHDHFINNLIDGAAVAVQRKDLSPKDRGYLSEIVLNLADSEKEGNSRAVLNHELVKSLDSLVDKFGAKNAKERLDTYLDARVSKYPRMVAYKDAGLDDDFLKVIKDAMAKAVDDVSGKAKVENVVKIQQNDQASVPAKEIGNANGKVAQKEPAISPK